MRWVCTIFSQSRFGDSIFLGGGLAHRSIGGLQVGKVRTRKHVFRVGQGENQVSEAWSRKAKGFGERMPGEGVPPAFPTL